MSGSVFLTNLDDYIAPAQACVNPTVNTKLQQTSYSATATVGGSKKHGRVTLETDFSSSEFSESFKSPSLFSDQPNLIKSKIVDDKTTATVSLNDCLACSGCVTSAETILIQEQSLEKFQKWLQQTQDQQSDMVIAVQISPNSVASIAERIDMSTVECFLRIAAFLKSMGVKYVVNSASGNDIALMESREEFLKRYSEGRSVCWEKPNTTIAVSATELQILPSGQIETCSLPPVHRNLPMLISHCPGWVCYAEKTTPQAIPYMSTVKSPQQIVGAVLKKLISLSQESMQSKSKSSSASMHFRIVSIQPCFDKKLEASRRDFFHKDIDSAEVDLVLSTTELWKLIECTALGQNIDDLADIKRSRCESGEQGERCESLKSPPIFESAGALLRNFIPDGITGSDEIEHMFRCYSDSAEVILSSAERNAGSGAFAEYLFKYSMEKLNNLNLWNDTLIYKEGRNADYAELVSDDGSRHLRFARAYGFRNIQTILTKMKRGLLEVDLVEISACPGGCNNGGGQLKSVESAGRQETQTEGKDRFNRVETKYHSQLQFRHPDDSPLVKYIYDSARLVRPLSESALGLLHTRYHSVPKLESIAPLAAKW